MTTRVKGNYAVHTLLFLSPLSSPSDLTIKFNGEKNNNPTKDDDTMLILFYFHYRLAWNFSVGQLSSKVLKSSQLVSSNIFAEMETCD